jgi:hypothetical protein
MRVMGLPGILAFILCATPLVAQDPRATPGPPYGRRTAEFGCNRLPITRSETTTAAGLARVGNTTVVAIGIYALTSSNPTSYQVFT